MKSDCDKFLELIRRGAYVDPSAEGFDEIARHAAGCPDCAARLKEQRRLEGSMRAGFRWADPGEGFNARVMRAVAERPRPSLFRRLAPVAAAAAIVLAVLAGLVTARPSRDTFRVARISGELTLAAGGKVGRSIPFGADVVVPRSQIALEVVRGVGLALSPESVFSISPASTARYVRIDLRRGGAAVSVKTGDRAEKLEVALSGFSILTSDADFLVETRTNGDRPGLYVDRGRVVVSFAGGVSVVERGEHVELVAERLLNRLRSGEQRIKADLATLEAQCRELRTQIARYEAMVRTYSVRRRERNDELVMAQEALTVAPDPATARELEKRISKEMAAVENLDFVMGEHIAKMSKLRAELPNRLNELRRKRALAIGQRKKCKAGLALLAGLR